MKAVRRHFGGVVPRSLDPWIPGSGLPEEARDSSQALSLRISSRGNRQREATGVGAVVEMESTSVIQQKGDSQQYHRSGDKPEDQTRDRPGSSLSGIP